MTTITRRIVRPTASNTDGTSGESASNNQYSSTRRNSDDRRRDDDERDGDDDDKETRLTLMEEVLLLGLKDREVEHIQTQNISHVFFVFPRVIHRFGMIVFHQVYVVVF